MAGVVLVWFVFGSPWFPIGLHLVRLGYIFCLLCVWFLVGLRCLAMVSLRCALIGF